MYKETPRTHGITEAREGKVSGRHEWFAVSWVLRMSRNVRPENHLLVLVIRQVVKGSLTKGK